MTTTRFAPSPTGYIHVGNLRTALMNYLIARKAGFKKHQNCCWRSLECLPMQAVPDRRGKPPLPRSPRDLGTPLRPSSHHFGILANPSRAVSAAPGCCERWHVRLHVRS